MKKIALLLSLMVIPMVVGCSSLHKKWGSNCFTPEIDSKLIAEVQTTGEIRGSASQAVLFWFITLGGETEYADGVSFSASSQSGGGQMLQQITSALNVLGKSISACKSAAAYKALENSGADYILNPRYTLKIKDYMIYKEVSATVEGEGCVVKGYKQAPDSYHYGCCK